MNLTAIYQNTRDKVVSAYRYCSEGVWSDTRNIFRVKFVKTINLSVNSFLSGDVQTKACAMTYRTVLAIVPALALILAIGRGFGLQDVIRDEFMKGAGAHGKLIEMIFNFVDSYLSNSSEGVFLGVGIVFLLWTLISIVGSIEHAFNEIWGVNSDRSFWRKVTDYLTIFIILPVLMICASGITVFLSTALEKVLPHEVVTTTMTMILDAASLLLIWLFFTGVYALIPNTKVKFTNALGAGFFAGVGFLILQWLFISGQVYVSKYNAIYGGFAFLPLFLIWVQLTWVITLTGAVVCYASQNIFKFSFSTDISHISTDYRLKIIIATLAIITDKYLRQQRTPNEREIADEYGLPMRMVSTSLSLLIDAGLVMRVVRDPKVEVFGYAPAVNPDEMTLGSVIAKLRQNGARGFIPDFDKTFKNVIKSLEIAEHALTDAASNIYIKDLMTSSAKPTK